MRQIERILGISFGSVRYNVRALKKNREVVDRSGSGRLQLFAPALNESDRIVYSHLRNRRSRKILRAFATKQKLTNRELAEITGFPKSTLSESMHFLLDAGILTTSFSSDARVGYQLRERERLLPMIRAADETVLEEATNRFIELWNF